MDELGCIWNYQEKMDVQQELVRTTLDEVNEYKQYIDHFTGILKDAYQKLLDIRTAAAPTGTPPTVASSPDSTFAIIRNQQYNNHQGFIADDVIDDLCRKLALPQKGSLLKVVMESEPLLSSLLVSVPPPKWRNPPPPLPEIPTISINVSPVGHNLWSTPVATSFSGGYAPTVAKRLRFQ